MCARTCIFNLIHFVLCCFIAGGGDLLLRMGIQLRFCPQGSGPNQRTHGWGSRSGVILVVDVAVEVIIQSLRAFRPPKKLRWWPLPEVLSESASLWQLAFSDTCRDYVVFCSGETEHGNTSVKRHLKCKTLFKLCCKHAPQLCY